MLARSRPIRSRPRREICGFLWVLVKPCHMSYATKVVLGTIGISLVVGIIILTNLALA